MESKTTKEVQPMEAWEVERVREVLRASGRVQDFEPEDMDPEELKEKCEIVARSKRLRDADFSISREFLGECRQSDRRFFLDEVGIW